MSSPEPPSPCNITSNGSLSSARSSRGKCSSVSTMLPALGTAAALSTGTALAVAVARSGSGARRQPSSAIDRPMTEVNGGARRQSARRI